MSVAIVIDSEDYEDFYICVSAEASYDKYWNPAIEYLGLKWAPYFQGGCFFEEKDWPEISAEMLLIKDWILEYGCKNDLELKDWFNIRFNDIISQVNEHFITDGRRMWIG